ncbi:MAG TPA: 4Fe-4S ferredoxin [Myxococcales bacterium]|jgi:Fe-S-cluster-containing hydrogenase component 2|nr:4Fe-4S ferredoxin [Myxococcales bacterium]
MVYVREELCPQNHRCPTLRVCPAGALTQDGFRAPKVDEEACIDCLACVRSCQVFVEHAPRSSSVSKGA